MANLFLQVMDSVVIVMIVNASFCELDLKVVVPLFPLADVFFEFVNLMIIVSIVNLGLYQLNLELSDSLLRFVEL